MVLNVRQKQRGEITNNQSIRSYHGECNRIDKVF